jgi:Reverse transcriptase (RNA-dependent DNA polymerase)
MASFFSLNIKGAFDNVSYKRLLYNLRKKKILSTLIRWIAEFLKDRTTEIRLADYTLLSSKINAGIPQGFLLLPILYLFYNADLLEVYNNKRNRTNVIKFIDDINILAFGLNIKDIYKNLKRTHIIYKM